MNLLSLPVLVAAGVLASPALWQTAMTGAVPFEVAVTRYLVVVVLTWIALSMLGSLVSWGAPVEVAPAVDAPTAESPQQDDPQAWPLKGPLRRT